MYSQIGCGAADKVAEGSPRVSWARGRRRSATLSYYTLTFGYPWRGKDLQRASRKMRIRRCGLLRQREGATNDDVGGEPDIALFRSAQSQYHGGTFAGRRRRWKFLAFLLCRSWWPQLRLW